MRLAFDGPLVRKILALAGPTVGAMISQTLINNFDHIMVGWLPPSESVPGQAAIGPALAMMWMVGGALSAIAVGTQALTARRFGEGDHEGAGRVLANSVTISLIAGSIASVAFWFIAPSLFGVLNRDPAVRAVGIPFAQWRYAAVLSMAVTSSYKSFFDGIGRTRVHFVVAVVMNVLNFVLNLGLIFGRFGLPRMGVAGSGLASAISGYVGCFMIVAWSFRADVRRIYLPYRWQNLAPKMRRELIRLSAPSSLAVIISLAGFGVFYGVCGYLDRLAHNPAPYFLSATTNIINIFMLVFISCIAYASAVSTLVGQGMGAGDTDRAERSAYEAAKIGALFFLVVGIFTVAAPNFILHLWCHDQPVIAVAEPLLRVLGCFEPFVCIALVFTYALYGAGDSRFVMLVELTLHLFCLIPLSYVLGVPLGLGIWGCWGAMLAYVLLMTIIMSFKFSRGSWKQIRI